MYEKGASPAPGQTATPAPQETREQDGAPVLLRV